MAEKEGARVPTGVVGFDRATFGGFVNGSVNLISGGPGTGKTIIGAHFIWEGIKQYNENGLFISLEEDMASIKKDMMVFGMDFDQVEQSGKCKFLYFGPFSSMDFQTKLTKEVTAVKAKRVVIDSISVFAMGLRDQYEIRKSIYVLINLLKKLDCTVIMTSEIVGDLPLDVSGGGGALSRYGVEEFVCDSVITTHSSGLGGASDRALRIVKMRRTDHVKGPIPMKITKKGIEVLSKDERYR